MTTTNTDPAALPVIEVPRDEATAPVISTPQTPRRPYLDLFLISFLILFFELAAIRWFGSTVVFLTFFTNIVLLACFLGMSVGLLTASRRANFIRWVIPLTMLTVALAITTFNYYAKHHDKITISVGGQQKSPQLIFFGTEYRPADPTRFVIPIEAVAGVFFTLIAITFIGLGQTMGRAFDAIPNRVWAYTIDVLGSLTGIAVFALMSFKQLSPHNWFILICVLLLYFVRRWTPLQVFGAMGVMFLVAISAFGVGLPGQLFWSPYYKITYSPQSGDIETNNIAHQTMVRVLENGSAYALPHLLMRDAADLANAPKKPLEDVMIIGAGSGNDVAAALHYGAEHIDAVEIDPAINQIGRWDHPDKPYGQTKSGVWYPNDKVTINLDDGRSFARKTKKQYDLAIYALVDSLVLHSGYSSIRLENFLFTKQAFEDVKKTLKPDGVFCMYNYYRQGWVVGRIKKMAWEVFGVEPIVISLGEEFQDRINPSDNEANRITFVLVSKDQKVIDQLRDAFARKKFFWSNREPRRQDNVNGFVDDVAALPGYNTDWRKIGPAVVTTQPSEDLASAKEEDKPQVLASYKAIEHLPEDNWPQLYLREKKIPELGLRGSAMIAGLSVVILLAFAWPVFFSRTGIHGRFNGTMFFLGAGFMLLETKGVVHMALLFGSTWIVNSVVFFAILVMILIANLYVLALRPRNLWPYYALLIAGLLVNALVPMNRFLSLDVTTRTIASCVVVFLPVFFAGVIFASVFRDSKQPDVDFGCNVAGIILGGLSEQLSLMIGFNYLILVAIAYYLFAAILQRRTKTATPDEARPALHGEGFVAT